MATIILFAPLVGAILCGFGWKWLGEKGGDLDRHRPCCFVACFLSWIVFLGFDGEIDAALRCYRWIVSGTLSAGLGHPARPADRDHADRRDHGVAPLVHLYSVRLHGP